MPRITRSFTSKDRYGGLKPVESTAYSDDGGKTWLWASNDRVIMVQTCQDYGIPCDPVAQEKAYGLYLDRVLKDYRKNQSATPSAEEQYEMRAAFGPGKTVVDVLSGRKYKT